MEFNGTNVCMFPFKISILINTSCGIQNYLVKDCYSR